MILHLLPVRVYYEDTDAGGVVYHANYLRFAERARTEMMRFLELPVAHILKEWGIAFAVRHCTMDFLAPAFLDDALVVQSRILETTGVTITFDQKIGRSEDTILAHIHIVLAAINSQGKPVRIPKEVRDGFMRKNVG